MTDVGEKTTVKASIKKVSVRTGRRYRPGRAADDYDVIVIGSGIGGLTNAALLALLGKKVCVLEQHYTAGGYTHAYERNGYEWDVGVHYIGEVHRPYSTLRRVFDVISQKRLQWAEMEPVYDRIFLGDKSWDFVAGRENFIESLCTAFPEEEQAIHRYVDLIRKVSTLTPKFFAGQGMPAFLSKLYNRVRPALMPDEFFQTTREVLEGLTSNQELISVLTGQWGDYGQTPAESAFLMHALIAKHYLAGGAYPVGGSSEIARTIIPTIQANGGEVFTYAPVEQVLVENDRAVGVRMEDGSEIRAKQIVSNIGLMASVNQLLPESVGSTMGREQWPEIIRHSSAHICLYAGFNGTAEELGLDTTNLWIYPDGRHEQNVEAYLNDPEQPFPLIYISFPSAKDPDWENRYPGKSTVEVVTITNRDWFDKWDETTWGKRGDDYEQFKEQLTQRLLDTLFKHRPQLKEAMDFYELSTPLSTKWFQKNEKGEIYGLDHFVGRFGQSYLHPQTPLKGFYLTGADVMTAGVGGAMMGGVMTTVAMEGLRGKRVMQLLKNG
ncbi:phytoene desaturase family protein [Parendozoicomonas haliclonae]|uniref:Phytoene desaturase (Lycopene-forming) n=1 Tax=Parendozoicomonas haliclonae TaxID=1960125 RepID=A0A1X7AQ38_9GAMM|nr:NAD(P)/FAD-dependent oxidoreductase [Parendozoicomonas haliclonae]SMA50406.1 Phytoene desaturase (lycopene-forming) [Parendozoicomonas haliclonae]